MSARFEVVRGDSGWWARFRAANGRVVFVSETYPRRHNAEKAVLSIARAFWNDGFVNADFARDEIGVQFVTNDDGDYIEVREIDERSPEPEPPTVEPPFYRGEYIDFRSGERVEYWHDHDYHWRNCVDECPEGTPPKGAEIRVRMGRVIA